jgi:hypothetical protein
MSKKYSKDNIPYEGDLQKAMAAQDREAIRFLMTIKSKSKSKGKSKAKKKDNTECIICFDKFNKSRRSKIECPSCREGCCQICFRKHLLSSSSTDPECVSCNHKLTLEFVSESTPKVFHNSEYRKKRANDLLSRERSLLPATQELVIEHIKKEKRNEKINKLRDEAAMLKNKIKEINKNIERLLEENQLSEYNKKKERKKFIMGCSVPDCRGFLSQNWKCGICNTYICSTCRVPKEDNHVCNDNDIATAKMLSEETKPCPSCAVPIFKIMGCDQMWCTNCNTPFCWKTGRLVTGVIHNPHFYEWQRENNGGVAPRRNGELRYNCGGLPSPYRLAVTIRNRNNHKNRFFSSGWEDCHRSVGHVTDLVLPRYPAQLDIEDHSDLRIKFLLKEISEKEWISHLQRRQKKVEKNQEIHNVLNMYVVTLTDIFQRFMETHFDILKEINAVRDYVNNQLRKISKRYNNSVPFIQKSNGLNDWEIAFKKF